MSWSNNSFSILAFAWQALMLILYGIFADYAFDDDTNKSVQDDVNRLYPLYQDVHVMIFIGFGFLMTFASKYSFSAVGFNFLVSALVLQWALLNTHFWEQVVSGSSHKIGFSVTKMIDADCNAASMMITFGALLGKVTPQQLMFIAFVGCTLAGLNFAIGITELKAIDMGGSMFIHTFGAYYGLACSWGLSRLNKNASPEGVAKAIADKKACTLPSKNTDLFAMIGTIFLWMYWPSFNGALATGNQQHRAAINTVISLAGSCVMAFIVSNQCRASKKFSMVDIQNATLAGGVAVGATADLLIKPWGAMLIGMVAGTISVLGFNYLSPAMEKYFDIHDTCGVQNLHGITGIMGAIVGASSAGLADSLPYGKSLGAVYPAMAPSNVTLATALGLSAPGQDRSATRQASMQMDALFITLVISIVGGIITGLIAGSPLFTQEAHIFDDSQYWDVEDHEHLAHFDFEQHATASKEPTDVTFYTASLASATSNDDRNNSHAEELKETK